MRSVKKFLPENTNIFPTDAQGSTKDAKIKMSTLEVRILLGMPNASSETVFLEEGFREQKCRQFLIKPKKSVQTTRGVTPSSLQPRLLILAKYINISTRRAKMSTRDVKGFTRDGTDFLGVAKSFIWQTIDSTRAKCSTDDAKISARWKVLPSVVRKCVGKCGWVWWAVRCRRSNTNRVF